MIKRTRYAKSKEEKAKGVDIIGVFQYLKDYMGRGYGFILCSAQE